MSHDANQWYTITSEYTDSTASGSSNYSMDWTIPVWPSVDWSSAEYRKRKRSRPNFTVGKFEMILEDEA